MTFIPSASCDSTNSRSNKSINTSRCPGCNVYCRSSTIGQQVCGSCASGFSIPKPCAANGTVAIRNFNAHKPPIGRARPLARSTSSSVPLAAFRLLTLGGELLLNQPMQMLGYRGLIETPDDFVQKAGD